MATVTKQTATLANVASSATSVALFAANGAARQRLVFNDSSSAMYVAYGATAASTTSFSVKVGAGGYYEFPLATYGGACTAIWDTANGFARTTEY